MKRKTNLQQLMALAVCGFVVLVGGANTPYLAEGQKEVPPEKTKRKSMSPMGMVEIPRL